MRIYESFLLNKQGLQAPIEGETETKEQDQDMEDESKVNDKNHLTYEYKLEDVLRFVDQLYDLSGMTYNDRAHGYTAHGKAWFKGKIHAYLRKLAAE